mgnify:CR=1 FL=1|tara:strand:+ start:1320 stop:1988 length:669 start_codon:yes stop_codon:yes gene_type:complete
MVHIGIIPDGNRRWCAREGKNHRFLLEEWLGQLAVMARDLPDAKATQWKYLRDVNELTLYVCSIDNVRRDDVTMLTILQFLEESIPTLLDWANDLSTEALRVNVIGDISLLGQRMEDKLKRVRAIYTDANAAFTLNLAIAYDYEEDAKNHGGFADPNYDTRGMSQIDVILRTGGDKRTSGFFPTKSYYAELFFLKKFWPELTLDDVNRVVRKFHNRTRRFGK